MRKNTICLWYDKDAEAAARFYAATFPDSAVSAVFHAPSDYPGGKKGDVLTVDFTVLGIPCLGLNGGPVFKHNEAFSFQIATEDQAETDRYWNAIVGNGGQESQCGWCKDKWGISWQITPRVLTDALAAGGDEAKRAFGAMMGMGKIDVAAIEAARLKVWTRAGPHLTLRDLAFAPRTSQARMTRRMFLDPNRLGSSAEMPRRFK
jgi:predicted 3-demethylubiquinone-9 3-methyltransferase (glyoxalase superfamily)